MATIRNLPKEGKPEEYGLPGRESRVPIRQLFVTAELFNRIEGNAELDDERKRVGGRLLIDHPEQTFCDFRCSERPPAGNLRRMIPTSEGIWKLHTPGLRIYGRYPQSGSFVFVTAPLENKTRSVRQINKTPAAGSSIGYAPAQIVMDGEDSVGA